MAKVLLARIDDRLIHGQVMTGWAKYVKADQILIVDNETFQDSFLYSFIASLSPKGVKIEIRDIHGAIALLKENKNGKFIVLAKEPKTFYLLIKGGIPIQRIILGGMGAKENRKGLYKNIAISRDEKKIIQDIIDLGVDMKIQVVPEDKPISVESLIKNGE